MKIVILCGGLGSRLGAETQLLPKPMVKIDKDPILIHILKIYKKFGFKDFILAIGYKGNVIKNYFKKDKRFKVKVVDTGQNTLTGGRLSKLKKYLKDEKNFMLTYGDGLSNQNLNNLLTFHLKHKKIATMTVVRPPVRFGEVIMKKNRITHFEEKPQVKHSWINGGFFVFKKEIFNFLPKKDEMLEKKTIESLAKNKQLMAYKHSGFWQCMDTNRDKELLRKLIKINNAPWIR